MIRAFSSITTRISFGHQRKNMMFIAGSTSSTSTIHMVLFRRGSDTTSNQIRNSIRNSSSYRQDSAFSNHGNFHGKPSLGVNTEWVKVMGVPPLSTIDDLLVDVERIMTTELNTGIVDLDAAEKLLLDQIQTDMDIWEKEESKSEPTGADKSDGKGEGDGDKTGEDPISGGDSIPLWAPSLDDENDLPPHMVIEAHMLISTLYRQTGWYLRFPNRSCAHALLSHIGEAQKIREQERRKRKNKYKKMKKNRAREKMERNKNYNVIIESEEAEDKSASLEEPDHHEKDNNDEGQDGDELRVPEFSWANYDIRPLHCGWKEVHVTPLYLQKGKLLTNTGWIDETVVRVENCPLESTVDDVRYFFRSFGLKDERIFFDDDGGDDTMSWALPSRSRVDSKSVQLVVSGETTGSEKEQASMRQNTKFTPMKTSTYLVKFNSSSDARSAVTEKQNVEFMGRKLRLAQFSRQVKAGQS